MFLFRKKSESSYFPLNNLPEQIIIIIMEKLSLHDRKNLASTSKYYYNMYHSLNVLKKDSTIRFAKTNFKENLSEFANYSYISSLHHSVPPHIQFFSFDNLYFNESKWLLMGINVLTLSFKNCNEIFIIHIAKHCPKLTELYIHGNEVETAYNSLATLKLKELRRIKIKNLTDYMLNNILANSPALRSIEIIDDIVENTTESCEGKEINIENDISLNLDNLSKTNLTWNNILHVLAVKQKQIKVFDAPAINFNMLKQICELEYLQLETAPPVPPADAKNQGNESFNLLKRSHYYYLKSLTIKISIPSTWTGFNQFKNLEYLNITYDGINDTYFDELKLLKNLKKLHLNFLSVRQLPDGLKELTNIKSLIIEGANLELFAVFLKEALFDLAELKLIKCNNVLLSCAFTILAKYHTLLKSVEIVNCKQASVDIVRRGSKFKYLRRLIIKDTACTDIFISNLFQYQLAEDLYELELKNTYTHMTDKYIIWASTNCCNLVKLRLGRCSKLTSDSYLYIARLKRLQELALWDAKLDGVAFRHLKKGKLPLRWTALETW